MNTQQIFGLPISCVALSSCLNILINSWEVKDIIEEKMINIFIANHATSISMPTSSSFDLRRLDFGMYSLWYNDSSRCINLLGRWWGTNSLVEVGEFSY
jgi:hypothetical protein